MSRQKLEFLQELIPLVKEEAEKIKQHATPEELAKLDPEEIEGRSPTKCIYGQMTGDCNSKRAIELIHLCCQKAYIDGIGDEHNNRDYLNGHPSHIVAETPFRRRDNTYLSPVERMLFGDTGDDTAGTIIAQYLKGETTELILNPEMFINEDKLQPTNE